ncbi:MAG: LPS export ABC transporter periplasmic protein LptC [Phormidesmis sp. RL_2_1]|nr:LPS export ABC transporter periplasmic protein LptC [Phormidesmis sp. RL_2_1]
MKTSRWYRWTVIAAVVAVLVVGLHTCQSRRELAEQGPGETIEAELTLQTVTLEQPDENGNLLWRLQAKSVNYSPDNQRAELKELEGEFFQAGETIYTVTADEGEVQQNGETLLLRGHLIATSSQNDLTLEGERLRWQPKQDLLVMGDFEPLAGEVPVSSTMETPTNGPSIADREPAEKDLTGSQLGSPSFDPQTAWVSKAKGLAFGAPDKAPVTGFTPEMEAISRVVTVSNKDNRVDLSGGVLARSKETPWMMFESEALTWFTQRRVIEAKQPLKVEQYEGKGYETVSDRLVGAEGQVQLAENIVTLNKAVQLDQFAQPLKVRSESALWDVRGQKVTLDQPVNIEQPERNITASANRARLDLDKEIVYLMGNVQAQGEKNDSRLLADEVTWQTATQLVEAEGNVSYTQAANPEVSLTGPRAVGNLEEGTVVVTGNTADEVVIEIVPDDL